MTTLTRDQIVVQENDQKRDHMTKTTTITITIKGQYTIARKPPSVTTTTPDINGRKKTALSAILRIEDMGVIKSHRVGKSGLK